MNDDEGLDLAEELVLCHLEDSPLPLWELGWAEAPSRQRVTAVLGPGLISLVARGLIKVRRFDCWPAQWDRGVPLAGDDLLRESGTPTPERLRRRPGGIRPLCCLWLRKSLPWTV
ncbi:hypothetical protein [Micromonospora sp. NBC_00860]|uniref:hypothetical protein n=1 Tax=Micromonospora sp. NBC_00860 TaxID=2975980 RepID=UPI00386F63E0|nr:hypothetical protein OH804_26075 [Micromonospora sp. NBC_00860]